MDEPQPAEPLARCATCDTERVPRPHPADLAAASPDARWVLLHPTCRDCSIGLPPAPMLR